MIKPPIEVKNYPARKFHRFFFESGPYVDFYVRGAVAWPWNDKPGFIVLGAQELNTKIVYVFEEYEFWHVEPTLNSEEGQYIGLSVWLNMISSKYHAKEFFWNDRKDLHDYFYRLCLRSEQIEVKPSLIEAHYDKPEVGDTILQTFVAQRKVRISRQSKVFQHLQGGDGEVWRGYHALRVLLVGMHGFPWKDPGPVTEDVREIWDKDPDIWRSWSR